VDVLKNGMDCTLIELSTSKDGSEKKIRMDRNEYHHQTMEKKVMGMGYRRWSRYLGNAKKWLVATILSNKQKNSMNEANKPSGFQHLLNSMMTRRWLITLIVLVTFMFTCFGIMISIHMDTNVGQEWKELLLLLLGAFIGSYGKIIDYWFSDTDKDKMLVQKMDEEDGVSLSNTIGGGES
jgi:hypothetical protein